MNGDFFCNIIFLLLTLLFYKLWKCLFHGSSSVFWVSNTDSLFILKSQLPPGEPETHEMYLKSTYGTLDGFLLYVLPDLSVTRLNNQIKLLFLKTLVVYSLEYTLSYHWNQRTVCLAKLTKRNPNSLYECSLFKFSGKDHNIWWNLCFVGKQALLFLAAIAAL